MPLAAQVTLQSSFMSSQDANSRKEKAQEEGKSVSWLRGREVLKSLQHNSPVDGCRCCVEAKAVSLLCSCAHISHLDTSSELITSEGASQASWHQPHSAQSPHRRHLILPLARESPWAASWNFTARSVQLGREGKGLNSFSSVCLGSTSWHFGTSLPPAVQPEQQHQH